MSVLIPHQWEYYAKLIQCKLDEFIITTTGKIPTKLYRVHANGQIAELEVNKATYPHHLNGFDNVYKGKNPKKIDVQRIKEYYESNPQFKIEYVYLNYSFKKDGKIQFSSSSAFYFQQNSNEKDFLTLEEAEAFAKIRIAENKIRDDFYTEHKKGANYDYNGNGYKFLGWQNSWKHVYFDKQGNVTNDPKERATFGYLETDYPEYCKCKAAKHLTIEFSANQRGTDHTVSCPVCKIYWKYDSSD